MNQKQLKCLADLHREASKRLISAIRVSKMYYMPGDRIKIDKLRKEAVALYDELLKIAEMELWT